MTDVHSLDIVDVQLAAQELADRLASVPTITKVLWRCSRVLPKLRNVTFIAVATGEFEELRAKLDSLATRASSIADCAWGADADHIRILERFISALSTTLLAFGGSPPSLKSNPRTEGRSTQWDPFPNRTLRSLVSSAKRELDEHWLSYMTIAFDELLAGNQDPLLKRAEALGASAIVNSVAMFAQLVEQFPILREDANQNWDFVFAVAGIFTAASELSHVQLGQQRKQKLLATIGSSLSQLPNGNGDEAFRNCEAFVQRYLKVAQERYPHEASQNHAIGLWAIWNVLDRGPATPEEFKLIRATGALIAKQYANWWRPASDSIIVTPTLPASSEG